MFLQRRGQFFLDSCLYLTFARRNDVIHLKVTDRRADTCERYVFHDLLRLRRIVKIGNGITDFVFQIKVDIHEVEIRCDHHSFIFHRDVLTAVIHLITDSDAMRRHIHKMYLLQIRKLEIQSRGVGPYNLPEHCQDCLLLFADIVKTIPRRIHKKQNGGGNKNNPQ